MAVPYVELHSHSNFSFLDGGSHPYELAMENVFGELHQHLRPEDEWVLEGRVAMAERCGARVVATNEVHYHVPARRRLHDVLVAIRHRATLDEARPHLFPNSEHHLKGGAEMRPLFHGHAEALATPWEIAQECDVDLDFRKVRFPGYPVPDGETPFSYLYKLCFEGVKARYRPITSSVTRRLQHELEVIEKTGLAEFFLINWDLMRFAKEHGVPGQGRGSAADSIVAYALGITRVDPIEHNLLFERFLHEEMTSTPDIDIDFSTEHREQVIQYIYDKYGWERTGMVCNVVTFQPRMAIRQVGKALGFSAEALDLIKDTTGTRPDLDALALNDPAVFEMCSEADTIGVFQIESRAQMQTLPRTRPQTFNDLVVEVAIIRPGPIQGNAVHPYIRRKQGREPVTYAHPLLEPILKDTLGVILYQEQIIEIAMYVAGMRPGRADGFRRAMTRHLNRVEMSSLEDEFIGGCLANEVPREVADQLVAGVQGFGV